MALIDVKLTAADKAERKKEWDQPYAGEDYPYGMCIDLDDTMLKKLGLDLNKMNLDEGVNVTAFATVRSMNVSTTQGKTKQSLSLQIEKIDLDPASAPEDTADAVYGTKDK